MPKAETWRLFDVRLSVEDDPGKDNHDSSPALCQAVALKLKCKVGRCCRLAMQHCICYCGPHNQNLRCLSVAFVVAIQGFRTVYSLSVCMFSEQSQRLTTAVSTCMNNSALE